MNTSVLCVEGVSKRFSGIRALEDVSIELRAHEVIGLVGENGAGKSTLLKVLAGLCQPDSGRIILRNQTINLSSASEAINAGIAILFQEQSLLPNLSVAENILLGHEDGALRFGLYDWNALYRLAAVQLAKLGSSISSSAQTDTLSFAERQTVELARVLAIEERTQHEPIILLDEPTSILDTEQIETILVQIERLRGHSCVVFVSHRLDEVLRVCDRIYVMVNGRCVAQCDRENAIEADLQQLMLGHELGAEYAKPTTQVSDNLTSMRLSVHALSRNNCYQKVSFELHAGEVLGIAGTAGSGRESLCRTLFGAEEPDSGEIELDGELIRLSSPAAAVQHGIGYVPAERRAEGIIAELSVRENMTLAHLDEFCRGPLINMAQEQHTVQHWIDRMHIKLCAAEMRADYLSGGNQQKLVLAKWLLARKPKILILDHPLRGLDVGVKKEIIHLIRELAQSGIGILLIADTLGDLIALSDSIMVMKDGVVSDFFPSSVAQPSELQILERMV